MKINDNHRKVMRVLQARGTPWMIGLERPETYSPPLHDAGDFVTELVIAGYIIEQRSGLIAAHRPVLAFEQAVGEHIA